MIKTVIEKGMRIGSAVLFLLGVICRRTYEGHPEPAPTAPRGIPIRGDLKRSTRMMPDVRRLILLSFLCVLASLAVTASASAATSFSNPTPIAIPSSGTTSGAASPLPSEIAVSGLSGPIINVAVTLHGVGHTSPDDIDILLVSPSGDDVMLMSDACGTDDIEDFTWTFSEQAPRAMSDDSSDCGELAYRPTNYESAIFEFDNTVPVGPLPYGTSLSIFNNENPNGTWRLWVRDDRQIVNPGDDHGVGDIEGGWSIAIESGPVDVAIPATGTSGPASPYPATRTVSGAAGGITDVNVSLDGIWHERPDDLDLLLVGPRGQKVVLMSDACGPLGVSGFGWTWNDEAAAPMPEGSGTNVCGTRFHKPTNHGSGDVWSAPVPAGPYATTLSAFDFTNPNGEWSMFVNDDAPGNTGFFTNRFQLQITTNASAPTVTTVRPAKKASGVGPAANVSATFSEAMRDSSINTNTFKLFRAGTPNAIGTSVSYDEATKKARLDPDNNLGPVQSTRRS